MVVRPSCATLGVRELPQPQTMMDSPAWRSRKSCNEASEAGASTAVMRQIQVVVPLRTTRAPPGRPARQALVVSCVTPGTVDQKSSQVR